MSEWTQVLSTAIRSEVEKVADPGGPLVEIEFWRARSAALSSLHEQLQLPNVRKMLQGAPSRHPFCASQQSCPAVSYFHCAAAMLTHRH